MAGPVSLKNAVIVLTDTDGSNTLTLTLEDGDLSYTLPNPHEHIADRGAPGTIIDGAFEGIPFSMSVQVQAFSGSTSVQEVVMGTSSGWDFSKVTTGSGSYNGKSASLQDSAVDVFQMKATYTNPFSAAAENLYFLDCVATISFAEGMPNKFTISGMSYNTAANFMANID